MGRGRHRASGPIRVTGSTEGARVESGGPLKRILAVAGALALLVTATMGARTLGNDKPDAPASAAKDGDLARGAAGEQPLSYGTYNGDDLGISVWQPKAASDDPTLIPADSRASIGAPVLLMVHGGGWVGGSRDSEAMQDHAEFFSSHGFLVLSADYSLSSDDQHLWNVQEKQIGCAMVWANEHAAELGGDPSRMVLSGGSAGAQLAMLAAYKGASGRLDPTCPGELPTVSAISGLYPASSPTDLFANPDPVYGKEIRELLEAYTGGTPEEVPDRYAATNPANFVGIDAPPTLLVVGGSDRLVPAAASAGLISELRQNDRPVKVVEVPGAGHNVTGAAQRRAVTTWQSETLEWFAINGITG